MNKYVSALGWILVFQAVAMLTGYLTETGTSAWYQGLQRSALTPPAIVFPVVWTVLYVMIALSGWALWQRRQEPFAKTALCFYAVQVLLNWTWTPLFFQYHKIALGFFWIVAIACFTGLTILVAKNRFRFSAILLIPYLIWTCFAAYLNGVIWWLN